MIHLRYRAADWADVRLAFTRTLSRPNYLDLAPWERETSDGLERGAPFLNNTRVRNYDLIVSLYSDYGLFTVGGFYKSLDGITYIRKSRATSILGAGQVDYYHPENSAYETSVYGMELEVQSNLSMLPSPFDGIILNFNYSLMRSKTQFPYQIVRSYKRPPNPQTFIQYVDSTRESSMPGQADQLANVTLGYEKKGLSVRLSMTYQGDALQFVGATPQQDGYSKVVPPLGCLSAVQVHARPGAPCQYEQSEQSAGGVIPRHYRFSDQGGVLRLDDRFWCACGSLMQQSLTVFHERKVL